MDILIKILQLILSLSILVLVHEFGHFFFARLFKTRVDKFYVFFNPKGSIVRLKKINGKWRVKWFSQNNPSPTRSKLDENGAEILDDKGRPKKEPIPLSELPDDNWNKYPETTEWGIGWVPLGGYCRICGMIDESMDTEQMKLPAQPWELRTKPAWQRLFVMIGGVMFNVILAILIYWGMLFTWGENYVANKDVKYGITCSKLAQEIGFRNGDKILNLDGESIEKFAEIPINIIRKKVKNIEVERDGKNLIIPIPDSSFSKILKNKEFMNTRNKFIISDFQENSPAKKAGLEKGDIVIEINSQSAKYFDEASPILSKNKSETADIKIVRNSDTLMFTTMVSEQGTIGVILSNLKLTHINYGFFEAFPAGINKGLSGIRDYLTDLGLIFSPKVKAYESVGSFISIGNVFPNEWIWELFWKLTAMLSIMLAVINILPIPALDGGHVVFVLYEMIFRRKPSDKFLEYAQMAGLAILLGLMMLALGNDIFNFILK